MDFSDELKQENNYKTTKTVQKYKNVVLANK